MKNKFYLSLIFAIAISALVSCSSKKVEAPVDDFIDTLGVITAFNDATYDEGDRHIQRRAYSNLSTLLSDLQSGNLDYAQLPEVTVNYLMKKYDFIEKAGYIGGSEAFFIGVPPRNKSLLDEINVALGELGGDGILDELTKEYLEGNKKNYKETEFEEFEGAPTITFAVTGNLPPIDYVNDEGVFSGFTTAFLSELGKKLKKNIKLVSCEPGARPAMLLSRKADALLWVTSISNEDLHPESFRMEGVLLSDPYLAGPIPKIRLKKQ